MNIDDKIKKINDEIRNLEKEFDDKVDGLKRERYKLIKEKDKTIIGSPYMRIKYADGHEFIFKITEIRHDMDDAIYAYIGKKIGITKPYYQDDYYHIVNKDTIYENISEAEFEELLTKGLDLIRKNII